MKKNKIVLKYEQNFSREEKAKNKIEQKKPLFDDNFINKTLLKIRVQTKKKVDKILQENFSKLKSDYFVGGSNEYLSGDFIFDTYLNDHDVKEGKVVKKEDLPLVKSEYNLEKYLEELKKKTKEEEEDNKKKQAKKEHQKNILKEQTRTKLIPFTRHVQKNISKKAENLVIPPEIVTEKASKELILIQWDQIEQMRKSFKTPTDNLIDDLQKVKEESRPIFKFQLLVYLLLQHSAGTAYQIMIKLKNYGLSVDKISALNDTQFEELCKNVGYPSGRMKHFKMLCKEVKEVYHGDPPENFQLVLGLPGLSPTTAAMYMNFIEVEGHIAITHNVHRVVERLRWIDTKNAVFAKKQLEDTLPKELWGKITHSLEGFGTVICTKSSPSCGACLLIDTCDARVNNRIFEDVLKKKEKHKKIGVVMADGDQMTESEEEVKKTRQVKRRKYKNDDQY